MEPETKNCEIIVSASVFYSFLWLRREFSGLWLLEQEFGSHSFCPAIVFAHMGCQYFWINASEQLSIFLLCSTCTHLFCATFADRYKLLMCTLLLPYDRWGSRYFVFPKKCWNQNQNQTSKLISVFYPCNLFWRSATLLQEVTSCVRKLSSCAASLRKSELLPALDSLLKIPTRWLWCSTQNCKTNIMLEQNVETQFCLFIDSFLSGFQMCKISTFYKTKILPIFLCGAKKSIFCHHMVTSAMAWYGLPFYILFYINLFFVPLLWL